MHKEHFVGVCLGASNIKIVTADLEDGRFKVLKSVVSAHDGNARGMLSSMLDEYSLPHSKIAVTGHKLKEHVLLPRLSEPEATELALSYLSHELPGTDAVISAGGENFMVYELDKSGKIAAVHTGNKCASGTGEFFLQQIRRMNLDPDEAQSLAVTESPYKVAGRCSVFCKSDCTHALNKGTPKGLVVAGLCRMMATKITELLKKANARNVLLIGGAAKNRIMTGYLKDDGFNIISPPFSDTFEALGASLWAVQNGGGMNGVGLFKKDSSSFEFLAPLASFEHKVSFKEHLWAQATIDDEYIIGLDAGSTTTKAVLMRTSDKRIVAGVYLRTEGDPVGASRKCYSSLLTQVPKDLKITGLGATGSGRQIVGLHGLTDAIINEIIAHTTAAVYFDPEVDTIFEIGGQDAKYTYITNKVPADYAMNEACSAGTGSFLEESAKETLNISTEDIASYALKGNKPPNFNDQCAAFIGSDIKTAIQEGISGENIAAGLVYAICTNYMTRVKSSRKVGNKIFMQGGVCYNKAVPMAMAALTGRDIIVPPDPGLMGAFGVALETLSRIEEGLLPKGNYSLEELAQREVEYGKPFVCAGGKEHCDRKCSIARIKVRGKVYPFGGACNKYYNERIHISHDAAALDMVAARERLVFDRPLAPKNANGKTVGISKSLMTNSLYPMYHAFLNTLGFNIVFSDEVDEEGLDRRRAPFCYPVDMAHGLMYNLIKKKPDYILVPHVRATPVKNGSLPSTTCPLIQGEPYVLRRTFKEELNGIKLLSPILNMPTSYEEGEKAFLNLGAELGAGKAQTKQAFAKALDAQDEFIDEMRRLGTQALIYAKTANLPTVVLFGRSYNAFLDLANMGIPNKFASRGIMIIPFDMLDYDFDPPYEAMHWAAGMGILKGARVVKKTPNLFGCYITNFSCGPDSFILNYFRDIMGDKPSLTLELDSHTADAGIDTRIEAFLDISKSYSLRNPKPSWSTNGFMPSEMVKSGKKWLYKASSGELLTLTDSRVKVLIPSMGEFTSKTIAAIFRYFGINAVSLPPPGDFDLQRGKDHSTCKECLPLMLTLGSLYNHLDRRPKDELTVYFMPTTGGSCRFAQYSVLTKLLINKQHIPNLAVMSITSANSYGGLGMKFTQRALWSMTISDVMEEIRAAVLTLSKDRDSALIAYSHAEEMLIDAIASQEWNDMLETLKKAAAILSTIPLHTPIDKAPKIAIIGEIYVRRDAFSQRYLVDQMADKGIVALIAPVAEWVYYTNYLASKGLRGKQSATAKLKFRLKAKVMERYEKIIKDILFKSNLYDYHLLDIKHMIESVSDMINPQLTGEAILTLSCALNDIIDRVDGVISIGPFGCMPSRIAESMIKQTIDTEKTKVSHNPELAAKVLEKHPHLPFISIESDGSPFPPVIEAGLESFILQAKRLHKTRVELR